MLKLLFDNCIKCGLKKPIGEFRKDFRIKRGYSRTCKKCWATYNREHYLRVGKSGSGKYQTFRASITHEEYLDILDAQDGVCAICGKKEISTRKGRLCIDHDHQSGKIRGLLCMKCNAGLGMFNDNESLLFDAITYLRSN